MKGLESVREILGLVDRGTLQVCLGRLDGALLDLSASRKPRINELRRGIRAVRREVEGELVKRYAVETVGEIIREGRPCVKPK